LISTVAAPRVRKSFSRLKHVLDLPNLIDIQKASFDWFLSDGLRETIDDISPIEDYTGTLAVEFADYHFADPQFSIKECREKDLTYQAALSMTVRFVNKETGEIREQTVFMGDFPMMTEWGTFIINGTERVIVTQLVRSPGAYLMEPKDAAKQVFIANLMPSRGSWLELEIDKKGICYARIDRKRKLPITTLLRALPAEDPTTGYKLDTSSNEAILAFFNDSPYIQYTLEKDPSTREEEALIEVFKKQRPGEPPTLENSRNLLRSLFFDPKRYDLTKVGRYKLNQRLGVGVPDDVRVLTTEDIVALVRRLLDLPVKLGLDHEAKDLAAEASSMNRDPIRGELDEYEHFGNRRLRTVGELIQEAFRVGLYRMERVVRERMTTEDVDTITPQTIIKAVHDIAEESRKMELRRPHYDHTKIPKDEKKRLMEERARVMKELGHYDESFSATLQSSDGDLSSYSLHMADQGTDAMEREKTFLFASRGSKFVNQLDDALARIEAKTYGVCKTCGLLVPKERLEAVPTAQTCAEYKNTGLPCDKGRVALAKKKAGK